MAMDFFESQELARRRTGRLVVLFALAVIAIIVVTYLSIAFLLIVWSEYHTLQMPGDEPLRLTLWHPQLLFFVGAGTLLLVGGGSFYKIAALSAGGRAVANMLGAQPLDPNTADAQERTLLNVVEEMALASGTPVPPVYIVNDDGINAFAAGYAPEDAVIGITRGALDTLSRDELQGVVAHEFSHILNGDMRLNIRLIGVVHGILVIGLLGYMLIRAAIYSESGRSRSSRDSNPLPLLVLGGVLVVLGYLGTFFGNLIKAAVSRQREYLADASAVQFTRNPDGIAGALKKIGGWVGGSQLGSASVHEVSHMLFSSGINFWFGLFATHPPLAERIRRIDPRFDGTFPEVKRIRPRRSKLTPQEAEQAKAAITGDKARAVGLAGAAAVAAGTATAQPPDLRDLARRRRAELLQRKAERNLIEQIGRPTASHVAYAHELMAMIPDVVRDAAREPFGARAIIFCMLIDSDETCRQRQFTQLQQQADPAVYQLVQQLLPIIEGLDARVRLPLVDLTAPALRAMSQQQYETFTGILDALIRADEKLAFFEWTLQRILRHHLAPQFTDAKRPRVLYYNLKPIADEVSKLLSALASVGHPKRDEAQRAFDAAARRLELADLSLLPPEQCSLSALDHALEVLNEASPREKRTLLEACALCISIDHEVTTREAELFRAIGDALSCPIPPLLPGQPLAAN